MPASSLPALRVKPREERRVKGGHPWIYSNELELDQTAKALPPGSLVRVFDAHGGGIGVASFNPHSLIAARLWSTDTGARIDEKFLAARLHSALALRQRFFRAPFYRLVHAEADGMPGFIIDRFGDAVAVQANTAGAEVLTPLLLQALQAVLQPRAIVLRNDSPVRKLEGLEEEIRLAQGSIDPLPQVEEGGLQFALDLLEGQKTGWYYDLAEARAKMASLSAGQDVLDCYCHTGAFALTAAKAGAKSVRGIDRSELGITLATQAAKANGLDRIARFEKADGFEALEKLNAEGARFGIVITDPPNFVKSRKDLGPGSRAYRKLAKLAAPLVAPGGFWFVACCAHLLPGELFAKEVAIGLGQSGRNGRIVFSGGAGPDHPVHPHVPESAYLKWQVLQLD
ncbi:class I SAM-dependent rRNA methyltransferase [Ferrovibrio xuzhouensis]|uniref:Class I SAM-dependent rRNA methyltransferase n=1 Tax=Ferrovibrio xuzhouensis TaxID=1576914 RepID=A0ABV7VKJ4_9PROT